MTETDALARLRQILQEVHDLNHAQAVLVWHQETQEPTTV